MADALADDIIRRHRQLQADRGNFDAQWEEVAERVLPRSSRQFFDARMPVSTQGQKKTEKAFDATAAQGLERFAAIMASLLTPRDKTWHLLRSTDPSLNRKPRVQRYFEGATSVLFAHRYSPRSGFEANSYEVYLSIGAFGNGILFTDNGPQTALRYRSTPLAQCWFDENHQGQVDTIIRAPMLTARQAMQLAEERKWDRVPECIRKAAEKEPNREFRFLHAVMPRKDADPRRLDAKGMPYASVMVCEDEAVVCNESGYRTMPFAVGRYVMAPGERYGRGPAMQVLPNIKVLNEQKKTMLKMGHRLVDPVLLAHDDGIIDEFSLKPGAINYGGVSADGKKLVAPLDMNSGQLPAGFEMMDREAATIKDAFLVTLFQILVETPRMTATEVLERAQEKGILLAPMLGRQQSELLGPMIERELDLLTDAGKLPEMPPELIEAQGEYHVEYDSPINKMAKADQAAGVMRMIELATLIAQTTQDPSALDWLDVDTALPRLADEAFSVPPSFLRTPEAVAQVRQGRQQAQAIQQMTDIAPAAAATLKVVNGG